MVTWHDRQSAATDRAGEYVWILREGVVSAGENHCLGSNSVEIDFARFRRFGMGGKRQKIIAALDRRTAEFQNSSGETILGLSAQTIRQGLRVEDFRVEPAAVHKAVPHAPDGDASNPGIKAGDE